MPGARPVSKGVFKLGRLSEETKPTPPPNPLEIWKYTKEHRRITTHSSLKTIYVQVPLRVYCIILK